jgi:hypothetical protein
LEDCGFKPLVLTTTQRRLRERDAVSAEVKAVAVKGTWFLTLILLTWRIWSAPNNAIKWQMGFNLAFKGLNDMRTSVAQGHYAGHAAWFDSDIRTFNSARHAVVLGQLEVFAVMFCTFYITYFLCIYHEL